MKYSFVVIALLTTLLSAAQDTTGIQVISLSKEIYDGVLDEALTPNYLLPIAMSDSLLNMAKGGEHQSLAEQSLSWYFSYVGEYKRALELDQNAMTPRLLNLQNFAGMNGYEPASAVAEITKAASKVDYLLINEAHHKPFHRLFTLSLLSNLKEQGYTSLAIETLAKDDISVNDSKKIDKGLGGLAIEPNYANLIRQALALGYKILPYDYNEEFEFTQRDSAAAARLLEHKVNGSKGKTIVHCGSEHVDRTQKSLVYWLEEMSKAKVLSVNQTFFCEEFSKTKESPFYQMAVTQFKNKEPFVLKNDKEFYKEDETSDIFVFHPRTSYVDNRPDWFLRFTSPVVRYPVLIPEKILKDISELALVQVYLKGEESDGIPVDQFMIGPDIAFKQTTFVSKGNYVIQVKNIDRKLISQADLDVVSLSEAVFSDVKRR
ncbi:MAG: hypothetical protein ACI9RU_001128 [Litorivivens sp.]|jgi:hypothetical protein